MIDVLKAKKIKLPEADITGISDLELLLEVSRSPVPLYSLDESKLKEAAALVKDGLVSTDGYYLYLTCNGDRFLSSE